MPIASAFDDVKQALHAPFETWELRKAQSNGWSGDCIESAVIEDRLDRVMGIENWRCNSFPIDRGVYCSIELHFEGRGWVAKGDAGGYPGMTKMVPLKDADGNPLFGPDRKPLKETVPDHENDVKAGFTDAFKRAAIKWGIGRGLHRKTKPPGGQRRDPGHPVQRESDPPLEPLNPPARWGSGQPATQAPHVSPATTNRPTGAGLFRWLKKEGDDVLKHVQQWARAQRFPTMFNEWTEDQARQGYDEADSFLGVMS